MTISYYAARANLYQLWQRHPDWKAAEFAAALGYSKAWVKKWLKRLQEELAAGIRNERSSDPFARRKEQEEREVWATEPNGKSDLSRN